jgi:hypothetical protein
MFERAKKLFPDAEQRVLDGATDFVMYQEPERFAGVLADFARRHHMPGTA